MTVRTDGKILVAGIFGSFLGQQRNGIALLNADGSLDTTFNPGTQLWGTNYVRVAAMVPQPDGKILVAGLFPPAPTSGPLSSRILRLNGDGTLDGTFSPVTSSADNAFSFLALQADGKFLAGGSFAEVNGHPRGRVARFNADGTIESTATFDAGGGIGGSSSGLTSLAIALQHDGRIVIGGGFTTVNGQPRNFMARLLNDPATQTLTVVDETRVRWQRGGAGPEVAGVVFELSADGGASWSTLGPGARTADGWELMAPALLPAAGIIRAAGALTGGGSSVSQTQAFSGLPVVTVSAVALPPTDGTVASGGNKPAGSSVTLVATPSAGCDFVNWTEAATPVSTSETYTFTAGADRTLVANFTRRSYTLTTTASHPAGGATSGGGTFSHGIQVSLAASPAVGYRFTDWTENGTRVSESPTMRFPAEGPRSLVANFTPATYAVNVSAERTSEGTVSGGGVFTHGATVRLVATPVRGHTFLHWSENGSPINRSTTLTFQASGNRSLVAAFAADLIPGGSYVGGPPTIGSSGGSIEVISTTIGLISLHSGPLVTTSVSPANAGSVVGGGRVNSSASVTVLATPRAGRTFANWTENGVVVSNSESYTFTPTADRMLVANFTAGNNANLASLQSHQATLTPAFEPNVTTYYAKVASGTDTFALAPALEQEGATIQINGASASADGYIPSVALNSGDNTIVVTVTAPDGVTSKTYTVLVTRGATLPGDINGDGSPDLILQNAAGQIAVWYTDASGMLFYSAYVYAGGLGDWKVAATVDLNRDGNADIICQNNAGQVFVWYTDTRGAPESFAYLSKGSLGDWKIAAAADMNGDGNPDLILQNGAGQIVVWHLNSTGN
ncbi:MAG: cadherin-like beta sandwich domain-containing protein, partial [Chthoniobacteraceae bacterium]